LGVAQVLKGFCLERQSQVPAPPPTETASSGPVQNTRLGNRPIVPDNYPAGQQEPARDNLSFVGFQSGRVMNQETSLLRCLAAQFDFHERFSII